MPHPRASPLSGKLADVAVDGPLAATPLDLVAGHADAAIDVSGTGYSPAGVLATLSGSARATVREGSLVGLDAGHVLAALRAPQGAPAQQAVAEALRGGTTPFSRADLDGTIAHGTMTLAHGTVSLPDGSITLTGSLDLPGDAIDTHLTLHPAQETAPPVGPASDRARGSAQPIA